MNFRKTATYLLLTVFILYFLFSNFFDSAETELRIPLSSKFTVYGGQNPCTIHSCLDIRKCAVGTDNLAVFVQPLLAVFDEDGNRQNPEPSADFLELREEILKSRHRVENFDDACLVLPGIDTLSTSRFKSLLYLSHSLDSAASAFPSKPNFIVFNLFGTTANFGDSIVVSSLHLTSTIRRKFDVSILAKQLPRSKNKSKFLPITASIIVPQPYGAHFPSKLPANLQLISPDKIEILTKCLGNSTCIDGKEVDYYSVLKTIDFVIISEDSIGFNHILMDAMENGVIPIFVSDLIVKPFNEFIDWSAISITVSPNKLDYILKNIDYKKSEISKMKEKVKIIFQKYFASFSTVIQSAMMIVEQRLIPTKVSPMKELFGSEWHSEKPYIYETDYLIAAIAHQKSTSEEKLKWMLRYFLYTPTNVSTILLITEIPIHHIFEEFVIPSSSKIQIEILQVPSIVQLPYHLHNFDPHSLAIILDTSYPSTNFDENTINTGFILASSMPHRISFLISEEEECAKNNNCPAIIHTSFLPSKISQIHSVPDKNNNLCFSLNMISTKTGTLSWISCQL